jgi:hypothetical protein
VRFHVEDFGDPPLHDEEMRVVDVELYGMEEVGDLVGGGYLAVDEVLALAADGDLARDGYFGAVVVSDGTGGGVGVVEYDGDACLGDSGLALFVDEFGEVAGADLAEVRDSEDEADGVEDVGFAGSVEACDRVEVWVESEWMDGWVGDWGFRIGCE